jgi:hypothetical protein
MKFRTPELFLGVLLAVAVFAMGMLFASSPFLQSQSHEQVASTQHQAEGKKPEGRENTQSLWVPSDSVGLYTLVLAIFTLLLVFVSGAQGYFLLRADKTARITAEAADLSAKAAIGLQLPIVRADVPHLLFYKKDPNAPNPRPDQPDVEYRMQRIIYNNRGKSIAYPKEYGVCWLLTPHEPVKKDTLPEEPAYDWTNLVNSDVTFAETFTADFFDTFRLWPSIDQHKAIMSGAITLRLCAYLKYLDFLDRPHEARFCWRYNLSSRGKRDSGLYPDDRVPDSYIRKT